MNCDVLDRSTVKTLVKLLAYGSQILKIASTWKQDCTDSDASLPNI